MCRRKYINKYKQEQLQQCIPTTSYKFVILAIFNAACFYSDCNTQDKQNASEITVTVFSS